MNPEDLRKRITRGATAVIAEHGWSIEAIEQLCRSSNVRESEYFVAYPNFSDLFEDLYAHRMGEIVQSIAQVSTLARALDRPNPTEVYELVSPLLQAPRHYDAWWIASSEFALLSGEDREMNCYVNVHNRWHGELMRTYDKVGDSGRSLSSQRVADAILGPPSCAADQSALRVAQAERSAWLALIPPVLDPT